MSYCVTDGDEPAKAPEAKKKRPKNSVFSARVGTQAPVEAIASVAMLLLLDDTMLSAPPSLFCAPNLASLKAAAHLVSQ